MFKHFQSAKRSRDVSPAIVSRSSHATSRPVESDESLRAIREFRRNRVASKRIPSRIS